MIVLKPYILAWAQDEEGDMEFQQNGSEILESGVASITKTITNWVARKWLPTSADLDTTMTVSSENTGPLFFEGDVVSIRDLMYAAAVPSDNTAPVQISDHVGDIIKTATGSSKTRRQCFIDEMQAEMDTLGYEGLILHGVVSNAEMSAYMVADLFKRSLEDPVLREMYSAMEHDAEIVGGPDPRTIHMIHAIRHSPIYLPGVFAAKTGAIRGKSHVVVAWHHPADGQEYITSVLNAGISSGNERYYELRKIIDGLSEDDPIGAPTIADFNDRYSGMLISDFNDLWAEEAEGQFQTQAFGNTVGARILEEDAYYRIESAQYDPVMVSFSARMSTTVADFNEVWEDLTIADFNAQFYKLQIRDFNTIPLRRDA